MLFRGHSGSVNDIIVENKKLISASSDGTIRIWNFQENVE